MSALPPFLHPSSRPPAPRPPPPSTTRTVLRRPLVGTQSSHLPAFFKCTHSTQTRVRAAHCGPGTPPQHALCPTGSLFTAKAQPPFSLPLLQATFGSRSLKMYLCVRHKAGSSPLMACLFLADSQPPACLSLGPRLPGLLKGTGTCLDTNMVVHTPIPFTQILAALRQRVQRSALSP